MRAVRLVAASCAGAIGCASNAMPELVMQGRLFEACRDNRGDDVTTTFPENDEHEAVLRQHLRQKTELRLAAHAFTRAELAEMGLADRIGSDRLLVRVRVDAARLPGEGILVAWYFAEARGVGEEELAPPHGPLAALVRRRCGVMLAGESCESFALFPVEPEPGPLTIRVEHVLVADPEECRSSDSATLALPAGPDLPSRIDALSPRGARMLREWQ